MKAIVTVIGKDQVGITAAVCPCWPSIRSTSWTSARPFYRNILPWSCLVDLAGCTASIGEMSGILEQAGKERGLSIRIQREDIFNAMHRI